jgi:hypothetical protein
MNAQKFLFLIFSVLLAGSAWAGGRYYGGIYFGPGPFWGPPLYPRPYYYPSPYWYPGPYYAPAPIVVVPPAPQVYIEQQAAPVEEAPEDRRYWYYCQDSRNYYPYVKECPRGWQKVLPQAGK